MLKLKQFNTVETEAASFGNLDNVDLYYQHYPELHGEERQGSMVPFGFRVLLAELPLHLGKPLEAMDRLYSLMARVDRLLHKGTYQVSQLVLDRNLAKKIFAKCYEKRKNS